MTTQSRERAAKAAAHPHIVSPIRGALHKVDQATRPVEERAVLRPEDVPGRAMFWRIVLQPWVVKYEGKIETAEMTKKAEELFSSIGQVLQIGALAFKSKTNAGLNLADDPNIPVVGQYVLHESYAGALHKLKGRGERQIRIINETDILMVVDDPEQFRGYL